METQIQKLTQPSSQVLFFLLSYLDNFLFSYFRTGAESWGRNQPNGTVGIKTSVVQGCNYLDG